MIDLANGLETEKHKKRLKQKIPTVTLSGTAFCRRLYLLFRVILRVNSDCFTKQLCLFV